jgi:uncharacterized protein YkwD
VRNGPNPILQMRIPLSVLFLLAALLALPGCETDPLASEDLHGPEVPQGEGTEAILAGLVVQHRASLGCGPIVWMDAVAAAAAHHAVDMATAGWWGHQGPNGESMLGYLKAHGVTPALAGDALARNFSGGSPEQAILTAWLQSPTHRAILEDCRFRAYGVGHKAAYWTWYGVR